MSSMKLFLFDLDGTLMSTGGAGLRALSIAFKEIFNLTDISKKINPSGKTDPAIFREIIRTHFNRDISDDEMREISQCYLHHLEIEMKSSQARALAGVQDFVNHVLNRSDIVVGLGTGNLEKGARLKLEPINLNHSFKFGGFGSDAEDRAELLKHGHRRAQEKTGKKIHQDAVFIIGDTPLDIAAARKAGYRPVGVASGKVRYEELLQFRPDFLMRDMTEGHLFLNQLDQFFYSKTL